MTTSRRADPEPITIVAAVAAVTGASIAALNYWRTHHKTLPHKTRRKLLARLDQLAAETRYLRADVEEVETIFRNAQFPEGRTLRLGNGALLTANEFHRYERVADHIFSRLKRSHKATLKAQGLAFELPFTGKQQTVNAGGDALARAERLIQSRNYSIDEAWKELRALASDLETMIKQLRADLGTER
jgi:hypothetical protein